MSVCFVYSLVFLARDDPSPLHLLSKVFEGFLIHDVVPCPTPMFVTCYGPSVYECSDGEVFGDWRTANAPTLMEAEAMKAKRYIQVSKMQSSFGHGPLCFFATRAHVQKHVLHAPVQL